MKNELKKFEKRVKELRSKEKNGEKIEREFKDYNEFCEYFCLPKVKKMEKKRQLDEITNNLIYKQNKDGSFVLYAIREKNVELAKKNIKELYEKGKLKYEKGEINELLNGFTEYVLCCVLQYYSLTTHSKKVDIKREIEEGVYREDEGYIYKTTLSQLALALGYITNEYSYYRERNELLIKAMEEIEEEERGYKGKRDKEKKREETEIKIDTIMNFYEKTDKFYKRKINKVLELLDKYSLLTVISRPYGIKYTGGAEIKRVSTKTMDEEKLADRYIAELEKNIVELSDEDMMKIEAIRLDTFFDVMDLKDLSKEERDSYILRLGAGNRTYTQLLFSYGKYLEYNLELDKRLIKEMGIGYVFNGYSVMYSKDLIQLNLEQLSNKFLSKLNAEDKMIIDKITKKFSNKLYKMSQQRLYENRLHRYEKKIEDMSEEEKQRLIERYESEEYEFRVLTKVIERKGIER